MHNFETVLALLVGVTFLALVARRLAIPTPAVLLAGGVLVALLPGLPAVQFDPQLVFLVFIPPLLFRASLLASYRDVRANLRPILLLGVGHVLFATLAVAWVAHRAVPGLPWASACALGAVVSPPDVAAATAFLRHPGGRRHGAVLGACGTPLRGGGHARPERRYVGRGRVRAGGAHLHHHRAGAAAHPRRLEWSVRAGAGVGCGARERDGHRRTLRVGVSRGLPPSVLERARAKAGPVPALAGGGGGLLGRVARRGVPRAGRGHSHHDRRGDTVPGPRPDHRHHLRRHPRDPVGPGLHAGAAVALARRPRDGRGRAP